MDDEKAKPVPPNSDKEQAESLCSCVQDPFAQLPPDLRPRPKVALSGLRKVICPGCGLVYWTNRKTDACMDCEKKEAQ